jgi:hypothetical protein
MCRVQAARQIGLLLEELHIVPKQPKTKSLARGPLLSLGSTFTASGLPQELGGSLKVEGWMSTWMPTQAELTNIGAKGKSLNCL